jgi:endonuclease/exonuclease/phosphatase family metal-dependent hydrolase
VFESAYGRNANYLHGHHGNAFLSRFPILRRDHLDVSDHVLERRGVLHCVVGIDGVEVIVLSFISVCWGRAENARSPP